MLPSVSLFTKSFRSSRSGLNDGNIVSNWGALRLLILLVWPGLLTHMCNSLDLIVMRGNKRFLKLLHAASSREPAMTTCKF